MVTKTAFVTNFQIIVTETVQCFLLNYDIQLQEKMLMFSLVHLSPWLGSDL